MTPFQVALADLVSSSGLRFNQNKVSYIFDCPRCSKRDKLYIRKSDGRFICWYCAEIDNFKGKAEYALVELLSLPLAEIRQRLYGDAPVSPGAFLDLNIKDWFGEDDPIVVPILPTKQFQHDFYPIGHKHSVRGLDYLMGRGIPLALAQNYNVHYCPPDRRVIFPVQYHDKLYGWQARTIIPSEWFDEESGKMMSFPKILTSEGLKREHTLMFSDRLDGVNHCVLTEGPISAIKAHLCGGNVATMGKAVSTAQIELLKNAGIEKLYLALDPDAAQEASRLAGQHGDFALYHLLPDKDADDIGAMTINAVHRAFLQAPRINSGKVFIFLP
jgi:hypothetical protein